MYRKLKKIIKSWTGANDLLSLKSITPISVTLFPSFSIRRCVLWMWLATPLPLV